MKTLLKIEQGFESQTFQLNFDSLKSFKMLETPKGINIHPITHVAMIKWDLVCAYFYTLLEGTKF